MLLKRRPKNVNVSKKLSNKLKLFPAFNDVNDHARLFTSEELVSIRIPTKEALSEFYLPSSPPSKSKLIISSLTIVSLMQ